MASSFSKHPTDIIVHHIITADLHRCRWLPYATIIIFAPGFLLLMMATATEWRYSRFERRFWKIDCGPVLCFANSRAEIRSPRWSNFTLPNQVIIMVITIITTIIINRQSASSRFPASNNRRIPTSRCPTVELHKIDQFIHHQFIVKIPFNIESVFGMSFPSQRNASSVWLGGREGRRG